MAPKRGYDILNYSDEEGPTPVPSSKRPRNNNGSSKGKPNSQNPAVDVTYGQRSMFPGLDGGTVPSDDDLEFEDDGAALAYLRSVRLEASAIPHLLSAPKAGPQLPPDHDGNESDTVDRSIYTSGVGDSRGYYQDGAYTAAPEAYSSDEDDPASSDDLDAADLEASRATRLRESYYASLTSLFTSLRAHLHCDPPPGVVDSLPPNHETYVGSFDRNSSTFRMWTNRLRYTDPLPPQIASMDKTSVFRLLRILLRGKFLRRGAELHERTSRWIWALLARLPDRGEMDYTEVGWVRELGKRAVLMLISIAHMAALREEVEGPLEEDDYGREEEEDGGWEYEGDGREALDEAPVLEEEEGQVADEQQADPRSSPASNPVNGQSSATTNPGQAQAEADEDGEMDMDIEDGEVTDDEGELETDIAAAKARLLARLDESPDPGRGNAAPHGRAVEYEGEGEQVAKDQNKAEEDEEFGEMSRSRVNMHATLNMILTVVGEFYGQRDLLEFRNPFPGV